MRHDARIVSLFIDEINRRTGGTYSIKERPEEIERNEPAVEAIAFDDVGNSLAIEHTLLQPFVGQKSDDQPFLKAMSGLDNDSALKLQNHFVEINWHSGAIPKGVNWNDVNSSLRNWLHNNIAGFPTGRTKHILPDIPFRLEIDVNKYVLPVSGGITIFGRWAPAYSLPEVVREALTRKLPKLVKSGADKRILIFEKNVPMHGYNEVIRLINEASEEFEHLAKVDEIWIANTVALESEGYIRFIPFRRRRSKNTFRIKDEDESEGDPEEDGDSLYPKEWPRISRRIRIGRAYNRCEICGVENGAYRTVRGEVVSIDEYIEKYLRGERRHSYSWPNRLRRKRHSQSPLVGIKIEWRGVSVTQLKVLTALAGSVYAAATTLGVDGSTLRRYLTQERIPPASVERLNHAISLLPAEAREEIVLGERIFHLLPEQEQNTIVMMHWHDVTLEKGARIRQAIDRLRELINEERATLLRYQEYLSASGQEEYAGAHEESTDEAVGYKIEVADKETIRRTALEAIVLKEFHLTKVQLQVHHKDGNPANSFDDDNLVALCQRCHSEQHTQLK